MTRRDYENIAAALAAARSTIGQREGLKGADDTLLEFYSVICQNVAFVLAMDNARFDPYRFTTACNR